MTIQELEAKLDETIPSTLYEILSDIWIEDDRLANINDLDKGDLVSGILEFVKIRCGDEQYEGWWDDIRDTYVDNLS